MIGNTISIKDLAHLGNQLNTINGGIAQPELKVAHMPDSFTIELKVPGLNPDNFNIMLSGNLLSILGFNVPFEKVKNDSKPQVPVFLRNINMPSNINEDKIEAIAEEKKLKIYVPFDDSTSNTSKIIPIKNNLF